LLDVSNDVLQLRRTYEGGVIQEADTSKSAPKTIPRPSPRGPKEQPEGERDYLDDVLYNIARIDDATEVLGEALQYAPFDSEYGSRVAGRLLSAGLDIISDATPAALDSINSYIAQGVSK
jgi:hypothetical protein